MTDNSRLKEFQTAIATYGKENLGELLYALAAQGASLSGRQQIRIYLEDLTRGTLSCVHAVGIVGKERAETSFPIVSEEMIVPRVFVSQLPEDFTFSNGAVDSPDYRCAGQFNFSSSCVMPIVSLGKSIGVICFDTGQPAQTMDNQLKADLAELTGMVAPSLDQARIYHQQVRLARSLEKFKAREAANMMVKSAVKLIEKVSLAAVLIPSGTEGTPGSLENLASFSTDGRLKVMYDQLGTLDLRKGMSLISNYMDDQGFITDERLLQPLYFHDLTQHTLQKKALTEALELRSLYVVPRFDTESRRLICLLNYYTHELYRFTPFEMGLLQTHAEMVERC